MKKSLVGMPVLRRLTKKSSGRCIEYSVNESGDCIRATFEIYLGSWDDVTRPESNRVDKRDWSKVTMLTPQQAIARIRKLCRKYKP